MTVQVRIIQCDHSCGGRAIKYAEKGVAGFKCANCGAEVVDLGPTIGSSAPPATTAQTRRQYF